MAEKNLYIISGCNGAGKTTASYSVLPNLLDCKQFVNADEIAKGLSPFAPESVAIQAGKLMLERIMNFCPLIKRFPSKPHWRQNLMHHWWQRHKGKGIK